MLHDHADMESKQAKACCQREAGVQLRCHGRRIDNREFRLKLA